MKIFRHLHRTSFTPSLNQGDRPCGDGVKLQGVPEDIEEEEAEPFVRISDGRIQHFSHEHHHLRLDENKGRDYDGNKQCQGCVTPIFRNFYSCMQCDFILLEECANLSRKIHDPDTSTSAHSWTFMRINCGKEECDFKLHVIFVRSVVYTI
ncbi:hypothetical protein AALP_AA8G030500 [Arabis alpina]|uniref:DC1 domain-containing protein n=1 Tax=Arabis alpina TaxID=50452 RepID=A0A087G4M7_ARAAL|nr:hypothetical protein AALP_AA8G030500 [Arabis alpina]